MANADSKFCRPEAITTPSATPATEPMMPTTSASSRTDPSTWRRLAPTARSSASSLQRCAMTIANVLLMMKAPTSSETPAKTISALVKGPMMAPTVSRPSAATSSLVTTS